MELLFPVKGPLSSSQAASILEAGLSYVLYQRGQIPLPYQQLQTSALQQKKLDEGLLSSAANEAEKLFKQQAENCSSAYHDSDLNINDTQTEELRPRERISTLLQERRKRQLLHKWEKRKRQDVAVESKAYNALQPAFEVLQRLLNDASGTNLGITESGQTKKVLSAALVLGSSLYSPKEVYSFDLPFPCVSNENNAIPKFTNDKFETCVLRQFYKKIITNADLMDFTSKPLAKTYAHICLVTLGDLNPIVHGNIYYKNVIRLPTIPPSLIKLITSQFVNGEDANTKGSFSSPIPSAFPNSRKNSNSSKCFKFKIHYDGLSSEQQSLNVTEDHGENCVKRDSFSGDILFDNNSFSCYQIPLRFKGIQCKNKRL